MIFEETITAKKGKQTITNNLTTTRITLDDNTLRDYCILQVNDNNTCTIKQGNQIRIINTDKELQDIIQALTQKPQKKTSKTTSKGKQNKKQTKEDE